MGRLLRRIRDRIDSFPTHRWAARLAILVGVWRYYTSPSFDKMLLIYLWWLSEVTAHESWLARKELENTSGLG